MAEIKDDAKLVNQHTAAATPSAPSTAVTSSAEKCVDVNEQANDTHQPFQRSTVHDDTDIDIIWHNLHADSDFTVFRKKSDGPMERILVDFARVVDAGVFEEVVSINASKYLFSVTVVCSKGWDEVSGFVGGIL
ncbi:Hypothetical protein PENO1_066490 [Penicillium occitanis (nom. inval.)]|nr:Hypothetical protein PENO1_066490 [Penicillium occitanis (nom. inval.)]PCH07995.1 hypothetical protein PENOC_016760 [Penicillium occitanis (nom. inval.)]